MAIARYHHPIWTKLASFSFVADRAFGALGRAAPHPVALAFYARASASNRLRADVAARAVRGVRLCKNAHGQIAMPACSRRLRRP